MDRQEDVLDNEKSEALAKVNSTEYKLDAVGTDGHMSPNVTL